jgi:hypothetical protein
MYKEAKLYTGDSVELQDGRTFTISHFSHHKKRCYGIFGNNNLIYSIPYFDSTLSHIDVDILSQGTRKVGSLAQDAKEMSILHLGIIVATDETSGNISKRWNHFENIFMKLANLPSKYNHPDYYRLISSGNEITWKQIAEVVLKDFGTSEPLSKGFVVETSNRQYEFHLTNLNTKVWNAYTKNYVFVVGSLIAIICDNPRASQICSVVQASGNRSCRLCDNNNSVDVFRQGIPRDKSKSLAISESMRGKSSKDVQCIRKATGITEDIQQNPYFKLPQFDPHQCTPPDLLHCLLLGLVKYLIMVWLLQHSRQQVTMIND